jgi:hypothetical protein
MRRRTLAPLLALPLLLVTSCSSSDPEPAALAEATGTANPTAATTPATSAASATAAPTAAPTTAAATSGATAATTTQAPVAQPLTTQAPGKPAASKATPAGTYTYDTSGSVTYNGAPSDVDGSATFTVSALRDGVQTSTLHADSGDTEQTVLVRDAGSYLAALHLTTPAFDKEFRPSPAALLLPDPATVGATWSWSATSTDGKSTVKTQHKVVRTETLTLGGKAVQTVVLQSVIAISGDVTYTADVTTWVVPSLRLPVKDHTRGKGTFGAFQVTSDTTSVMRSTVPA